MKVSLIYPNFPEVATQPPLGLMYIASYVRAAGHEVKILEGNSETVIAQLDLHSDVIGITCMSSMYHEILKMRDFIHKFDIPIVFGGAHATMLPHSLLLEEPHRDYVVIGGGESHAANSE